MDIGCYIVHASRMISAAQPVLCRRHDGARSEDGHRSADVRDARFRRTAGLSAPAARRWCSTSASRSWALAVGSRFPFRSTRRRTNRLGFSWTTTALTWAGATAETLEFGVCDQYTIQGELFSRAILEGRAAPYPLEDSVRNMQVIDALVRSVDSAGWVVPTSAFAV